MVSERGALPWCFCALKGWGVPPLLGPLWKVYKKRAIQLVVCSLAPNTGTSHGVQGSRTRGTPAPRALPPVSMATCSPHVTL